MSAFAHLNGGSVGRFDPVTPTNPRGHVGRLSPSENAVANAQDEQQFVFIDKDITPASSSPVAASSRKPFLRSNEQVQQVRAVSGGGGGGGGSAASPPLSQPQQQGSASGQQHKIMTTEFRTNGNSEAHRGGGGGGGGNGKRQITKPSSGNRRGDSSRSPTSSRRGDSSRSPTSSRRGDSSRSPTASISSRQKSLSPSPFSLPRNNTTTATTAAGNGNGGSRAPSSSTNASRAWDFVPRGPPKDPDLASVAESDGSIASFSGMDLSGATIIEGCLTFPKFMFALMMSVAILPFSVFEGLLRAISISWNEDPVHEREPPVNICFDLVMMLWYRWVFGVPDSGYRRNLKQSSVASGLVVLVKEANISLDINTKDWRGASVVTRRLSQTQSHANVQPE